MGDDARDRRAPTPASLISTAWGRERHPPAGTGPVEGTPEPGGHVGRHLVLRVLGRGAMGVVFQAYDPELDRRIAVKLLRAEFSGPDADPGSTRETTSRLRREAQAMARLSHPNVVAVHDVGDYEGQVYVAMEFVDGRTLREFMDAKPRPSEILEVFRGAGKGLAAAHAKGLIHRDFKPENVMVDKEGRARVMDFGLARAGHAPDSVPESVSAPDPNDADASDASASMLDAGLTQDGAVVGTPRYMAPEQFTGGDVDARSDQFAYCVALYEALFGQTPFPGESVAAIAFNVTQGQMRETPPRVPGVPKRTYKALSRGLSTDPAARWPDMNALLAALEPSKARRLGWVGGIGLVAASVGVGLFAGANAGPVPCPDPAPELHGVWDAAKRADLRAAFEGSGLGHATRTLERVDADLDVYAQAWLRQRKDACEATRIRGEQSEALLDLRVECLAARRQRLQATVDVLASADAAVVQRAIDSVQSLPGLEACADRERLRAKAPLPEDPQAQARIESVQAELAQSEALTDAGRYEDAHPLAHAARTAARETGYGPLIVRAEANYAELLDKFGRVDEAAVVYAELFNLALVNEQPEDAADAALKLAEAVGVDQNEAKVGAVWLGIARALIHKAKSDRLELNLEHVASEYALHTDDLDAALGHAQRAVELAPQGLPRASMLDALATVLTRHGKLEQALSARQNARMAYEEMVGPEHPDTLRRVLNEGTTLFTLRRLEEAHERFARVTAAAESAFEGPNTLVADGYVNLGVIEAERGENESALEHLAAALAIYDELGSADHPNVRRILTNMGSIEVQTGDFERARGHFDRVLASLPEVESSKDPEVGAVLTNYGDLLTALGEFETALNRHRQAEAIMTAAMGPEAPWVAYPLHGAAEDLLGLERWDEAAEAASRALAIRTQLSAPPVELEGTRWLLARARWGQRKRGEASTLLDTVRAGLDATPSDPAVSALRAKVEAWADGVGLRP